MIQLTSYPMESIVIPDFTTHFNIIFFSVFFMKIEAAAS